MSLFSTARQNFDIEFNRLDALTQSLVPVNGKPVTNIRIRDKYGKPLEEFFKWQFIYALIYGGMYSRDYIGVEIHFPKGSKGAKDLIIDAAIFDSPDWVDIYNRYWTFRDIDDLQWLNNHLIAIVEFKRGEKDINSAYTRQIKPAMREKEPGNAYILGMFYDAGRLWLFHRRDGKYLRFDEAKNQKGPTSGVSDLSLHLPDPFIFIPSLDELTKLVHGTKAIDITNRTISDLEVITSITTNQMQDALSNVLRVLDKAGLVNQRGYEILIQAFAMKIFDEKRNEKNSHRRLEFYIAPEEANFDSLHESAIQQFIKRMKGIVDSAEGKYEAILKRGIVDWQNINHVRAIVNVCQSFQDFSFVQSSKSDLYQLVFYNFANKFQRDEKAQFLTPLPVIDFIVKVVNPRNGETVFDPCCGIGDFLSLSFVNSQEKLTSYHLDDGNIYGADISEEMITLASLNMLLNGDGDAHLFHVPDHGSLLWKIKTGNPPTPTKLIPEYHKQGDWDAWPNQTKLMTYDVILTNPPFGDDRAFRPRTKFDKQVAEMYETYHVVGQPSGIDLGVIFLENAYRLLKENGRLGIVLSNSIASIDRWYLVRKWLMERMRIVALFDLPPNVFAETGVNTTIIVAYKPSEENLARLQEYDYSVFARDIQNVGYEKRTSKRNVYFNPIYQIDESDFEIKTDEEGNPILLEDFSEILQEFRQWAIGQEETLQRIFVKEN